MHKVKKEMATAGVSELKTVTVSETKSLQDLNPSDPEAKTGVDQEEGSREIVPERRKDSSASSSLAPDPTTD